MGFLKGVGPVPVGFTTRQSMLDQIMGLSEANEFGLTISFATRLMDAKVMVEDEDGVPRPVLAYFPGRCTGNRKFFKSLTDSELMPYLTRAIRVERAVYEQERLERGEAPAEAEDPYAAVANIEDAVNARLAMVRERRKGEG